VVIPYARWIKVKDERRSELPKFLNLLEMCTILHGPQRDRLPTGEVLATFGDYEEAAILWKANERYHSHVSEKESKLLDLMAETAEYTKEDLSELTGSQKGRDAGFRKQLSEGSIENYLSKLRTQDLITSRRMPDTKETVYRVLRKPSPIQNLNSLTDLTSAYLTASLELQLPSLDELASELRTICQTKLTNNLGKGVNVVPIDYQVLAQEILDTSALTPVKKLRIEQFDNAGNAENGLNLGKLDEVKKLRAGEQAPISRLTGLTVYWQQIETVKALVRAAQKSGYGETWVFEKCDEARIADPDSKIKWLLSRGDILKTDEGFRLARDG
jgi:hypothetical protein